MIRFLLLFFVTLSVSAQSGIITGTVCDSDTSAPLQGASVTIRGNETLGTSTDAEGRFTLTGVPAGTHTLLITYVGYDDAIEQAAVTARTTYKVEIFLYTAAVEVGEVVVMGSSKPGESEQGLIMEQMESLVVIHTLGSQELSRKGLSNAETAVAQVAGVSKQDGAKNVLVRGLGDRYNVTMLNGFPIPSEDPEYKNIALDFFGTDIIRNIGVNKVFEAGGTGDVGGAIIDVRSKEMSGDHEFSIGVDAGVNSRAIGAKMLRQDGVSYTGVSNNTRPAEGTFDFPNKLQPRKINMPLNHSFGFSGGKRWNFTKGGTLAALVIGGHGVDYSYSKAAVRNGVQDGLITQDQTGERSTVGTNQLLLANLDYSTASNHSLSYDLMLLHDNEQYVGEYRGFHAETYQDAKDNMGVLIRQQSNDNLLVVHQLHSTLALSHSFELQLGASYNRVLGNEPDRRENNFSLNQDGTCHLTGGTRQRRFFSRLHAGDLNVKAALRYRLGQNEYIDHSNITVGYKGRFANDKFNAVNYNLSAYSGNYDMAAFDLDALYNRTNYSAGEFTVGRGEDNWYKVRKNIHTAYIELTHRLTDNLAGNIGVQADLIDRSIDYYVDAHGPGSRDNTMNYFLPSMNLRYDLSERSSLRLGASKSYILPQSKEIAPFQYVNIGYASEGNPDLRASDCYNVDLKWDFYPTGQSEIVSLGVFYKHIVDPMGRVDTGGSANLLTYDNLADRATVAGVEFEARKNLTDKIAAGLNMSYIYSNLTLDVVRTERRKTELEGASPFILNADLTYNDDKFMAALVANYTSNRINTLGTQGYSDIIEHGTVALSVVSSYDVDDHWSVKLKAANLLDPAFRLTQNLGGKDVVLDEYKKGMGLSVGVGYKF